MRLRLLVVVLVAAFAAAGCGAAGGQRAAGRQSDPPLLVPWSRVGDVALGAPRARVVAEYGRQRGYPQPAYRLHGGRVWVTYDAHGRVATIGVTSPYYRTRSGFGIGSTIPLGPCHRTATRACEHRWHGFVFDAWRKEKPCDCWTKVGLGARSLPATGANFLKPWFIINVRHGRVTELYFASHYVD